MEEHVCEMTDVLNWRWKNGGFDVAVAQMRWASLESCHDRDFSDTRRTEHRALTGRRVQQGCEEGKAKTVE